MKVILKLLDEKVVSWHRFLLLFLISLFFLIIYYTVSTFFFKCISCITLISLTICSTLCIMSQTVGMIIYVSFYLYRLLLLTANFVICVLFDPSLNVRAGILKVITEMFLPHIGLSELEEECFSKILPKVHIMSF